MSESLKSYSTITEKQFPVEIHPSTNGNNIPVSVSSGISLLLTSKKISP